MQKVIAAQVVFFLSSLVLYNQCLQAETSAKKEKDLEQEEIIEVKAKTPGKGRSGTFEQLKIRSGQNRFESRLTNVMRNQSGVQVNRFGAPGSFSTVSIRGAKAAQTNVYLDGIALNSALGGSVNLENIPVDILQSAELYRSYVPIHLNGVNIGGAVDLIPGFTQKNEDYLFLNSVAHSLYGGSLGLGYASPNQIHYAMFEGSTNEYTFLNDQGTRSINFADDVIETRENEDFSAFGYTGIFALKLNSNKFKILTDIHRKERGLPGVIGVPLEFVRLRNTRGLIKADYTTTFTDFALLKVYSGLSLAESRFTDPSQELGVGTKEQRRQSWRLEGGINPTLYLLSDKVTLNINLSDAHTRLYLNDESLADRNSLETGSAIAIQPNQWLGKLVISGKYNLIQDQPKEPLNSLILAEQNLNLKRFDVRSAQARLSFFIISIWHKLFRENQAKTKDPLELFTSAKYSERAPSLTETYGNGNLILPNPDLLEEKSTTYSLGFSGKLPCRKLTCKMNTEFYMSKASDLILLIQSTPRTSKAFNVSQSETMGFEASLEVSYQHYFSIRFKGNYTDAFDTGVIPFYNGKRLPFIPRFTAGIYAETGTKYLRFFANSNLQGKAYLDQFNQENKAITNRLQIDTGISYSFLRHRSATLTFIVRNITDQLNPDIFRYPLPGRYFEIQFKKKFLLKKSNKKTIGDKNEK